MKIGVFVWRIWLGLLCCISPGQGLIAQPFVPINTSLPSTFPNGTTWVDYDADGDMDLLLADLVDTNTEEPRLYRNDGNGTFVRVNLPPTRHSYYGFANFWADDNRDGRLDLLLTASDEAANPVLRLFHGVADGSFVDTQVRLQGAPLLWADLDNDGDLDILASSRSSPDTCWLYWNQNGTNYLQTAPAFGTSLTYAAAIDVDGDGDADLLITTSSQSAKLFRNDGSGRFTETGERLPARGGIAAAWVDADGDGDLDLLDTGKGPNSVPVPRLYRNEGNLRFTDANPELPVFSSGTLRWADFDQDGDADVINNGAPQKVANQLYDPRVRIFFNDGSGRYTESTIRLPTFEGGGAEVADMDGDGDVDFMISGEESSTSNPASRRIYRNDRNQPGGGPTVLTNLAAEVSGHRVILRWNRAAGDPNRTTFNLRVGTQPGAGDVISPLAGSTGRRLVPVMGNAQCSTNWYLVGLSPGTYYWSVQAVDQSYRTSPFAVESSFVMEEPPPLPPPTISALPHQFTDEDVPTLPVSFTIGPESSLPHLSMTAEASNPTLAPATGIVVSGNGTNRVLAITPGRNQSGTSLITVRVTDANDQSASSSFLLTVNPVNDPPTLDPIPNQVTYENSSPLLVPVYAADAETNFRALTLTAVSSNPGLIPQSGLRRTSMSVTNDALQITPQTNRTGSAIITVTISDGATEASAAFVVSVLPRPFVATTNLLPGYPSGTVVWADFDRDADLDLLLTGSTGWSIGTNHYYRNDGLGTLTDTGLITTGPELTVASTADYDRDGDVDVLMLGYQTARLFRNESGTNFTVVTGVPVSGSDATVAWGDVDNDGDLDLVACDGAAQVRVLFNSNDIFSAVSQGLPAVAGNIALGDHDGDGVLDLAFSGTASTGATTNGILLGLGGGRFAASGIALDQSSSGPVGWCDVDADGRLDFWQLGVQVSNKRLLLYRNLGAGQLATPVALPLALLAPYTLKWADFDGDGDLDFLAEVDLVTSQLHPIHDYAIGIYRNNGGFQFTSLGDPLPNAVARFIGIGDFDNDGDVDLSALMGNIRVFTNRVSQPNPPPGPPIAPQARVEGQSVWLSWRSATDFNQSDGLTYNVRVGTRSGANDVVPAMSLTNGFRLVAEFGNAGVRTNFFLTNLIGETFYWSVQAVDNGYLGGPFAPEQRFVVNLPGNQPPGISEIADQTMAEDSSLTVPFTMHDDRTAPDQLRLRAFAADPFLLPSARLTLGGSGTNRTLTLTPATNRVGQTTITVEATDAVGSSATRTFTVVVSNLNDAPFISAIPTQTNFHSTDPWLVQFTIGDPETPADQLQLTGVSSNPAVVPSTNIVFSGTGSNRIASILAPTPLEGETAITISVADPDGATNSRSFLLVLRNEVFRLLATPFGGVRFGSIAWGDYDNDGDLDLALAGDGLNQTALYRNEGGGVFVKADTDLPNSGNIESVDFDNDGDLDLCISYRTSAGNFVTNIYRNLGNGQFTFLTSLPGRNGPAAWGDYDNDGKLDVVITGEIYDSGGFQSVVYHNDGGGVFRSVTSITNSIASSWLISSGTGPWLDADGDGILDLLLQRFDGFNWRDVLFLGDGRGRFSNTPLPWTGSAVAWTDFDGDGHPDVLESTGTRQNLRVLGNLGNGSFTPWGLNIQSNWTPDSVAVGDFNNDGFPDLLSSGYEGDFNYQTRLFQSQGTGGWFRVTISMLDFKFATASWADIDNDGDVDFLINGQRDQAPLQGHSTLLYRNDQLVQNSRPTAPTSLKAFFTSNTVTFTWQPATDSNQTGGLTYNVRVGTAPGAVDVLSPMSASNGYRLVPKPGNAGWLTRKLMNGLQRGRTYYWSVQAVDHSFVGSPFAAEASLTIGELPALGELADQTMDEDGILSVPLSISDPDGDAVAATVTASSTNTSLLPQSSFAVIGMGTNRTLVIQPAPDRFGVATVVVSVVDVQGGLASRLFTLVVQPVNDPPRVPDQTFTLAEDSSLIFSILASDPEGDPLNYAVTWGPYWGDLLGASPPFTYRPQTNFFGDDWCEFSITDSNNATTTVWVNFRVTPVPDTDGARISVRFLSDRTPFLALQGEPYQAYVIETSGDLRNWTPVGIFSSSDGRIEFVGAPAGSGDAHFYRARLP